MEIYKLKDGYQVPTTFLGIAIGMIVSEGSQGSQKKCWGLSSTRYVERVIGKMEI